MSDDDLITRIAHALYADWEREHPIASQLAAVGARLGAVRAARIALREMRAVQEAA